MIEAKWTPPFRRNGHSYVILDATGKKVCKCSSISDAQDLEALLNSFLAPKTYTPRSWPPREIIPQLPLTFDEVRDQAKELAESQIRRRMDRVVIEAAFENVNGGVNDDSPV